MKNIKTIFTDKASLIYREMLKEPDKKWGIKDFIKNGLSPGWVSEILTEMEKEGYVHRISRGSLSYTVLKNQDMLIKDWVTWYKFKYNTVYSFYSQREDIEERIIDYFKKKNTLYALTLFSGARRVSPYVKDPNAHIYIKNMDLLGDIVKFKQDMELLELKEQGNVFLVIPYYKKSVFNHLQSIKGVSVVSFIQLYIDLYTYNLRGKEQAEYLLEHKRKMGNALF